MHLNPTFHQYPRPSASALPVLSARDPTVSLSLRTAHKEGACFPGENPHFVWQFRDLYWTIADLKPVIKHSRSSSSALSTQTTGLSGQTLSCLLVSEFLFFGGPFTTRRTKNNLPGPDLLKVGTSSFGESSDAAASYFDKGGQEASGTWDALEEGGQ